MRRLYRRQRRVRGPTSSTDVPECRRLPTGQTTTILAAQAISAIGGVVLRLGLIPLAWYGTAKFTSAEAHAIMPLITHQPLMSWLYDVLSVQAFSIVLGCLELLAAILIAVRPLSALAAAIGSAVAILLFLSTISFLFTTPGVLAPSSLHVPMLTDVGGFLVKDVALLGVAVWTLVRPRWRAARRGPVGPATLSSIRRQAGRSPTRITTPRPLVYRDVRLVTSPTNEE